MSGAHLISDLDKLASIANVQRATKKQFVQMVRDSIDEAHHLTTVATRKSCDFEQPERSAFILLEAIANQAKILEKKIEEICNRPNARRRKAYSQNELAKMLLEAALKEQGLSITTIKIMAASAASAAQDAKVGPGRPTGTTGRANFDLFALQLFHAVRSSGGNLTVYRSELKASGWDGTFLQAMSILRPHLPTNNFAPWNEKPEKIARILNRIAAPYRRKKH
jgi:hypothetical protein